MFDVVDRDRQDAFVRIGDALLELLGIKPRVLPDHAHHRDVNRRKNICRRPHQDERRQHDKQQGGHHERVRADAELIEQST